MARRYRRNRVRFYVDDKFVRTINRDELGRDWYFFEELSVGKHTIKWVGRNPSTNNSQYIDIQFMHVYATPKIEVNLAQAGSLGTEVLYNVDNIDKVRNLKVSGPMNADDFAKIMDSFIADKASLATSSQKAGEYVKSASGATDKVLDAVNLQ